MRNLGIQGCVVSGSEGREDSNFNFNWRFMGFMGHLGLGVWDSWWSSHSAV